MWSEWLKVAVDDVEGDKLSPSGILDQVWHTHLLNTKAYREEVAAVFEQLSKKKRFLDHSTDYAHDADRPARRQRTELAYQARYAVRPLDVAQNVWD